MVKDGRTSCVGTGKVVLGDLRSRRNKGTFATRWPSREPETGSATTDTGVKCWMVGILGGLGGGTLLISGFGSYCSLISCVSAGTLAVVSADSTENAGTA